MSRVNVGIHVAGQRTRQTPEIPTVAVARFVTLGPVNDFVTLDITTASSAVTYFFDDLDHLNQFANSLAQAIEKPA